MRALNLTAFEEEEKIELFVPWVSQDGHPGHGSNGSKESGATFGVNAGNQTP